MFSTPTYCLFMNRRCSTLCLPSSLLRRPACQPECLQTHVPSVCTRPSRATLPAPQGRSGGLRPLCSVTLQPLLCDTGWTRLSPPVSTPGPSEGRPLASMSKLLAHRKWLNIQLFYLIKHWKRNWQPTPVFLPGKPHGERSLTPQGGKESDMTEAPQHIAHLIKRMCSQLYH